MFSYRTHNHLKPFYSTSQPLLASTPS